MPDKSKDEIQSIIEAITGASQPASVSSNMVAAALHYLMQHVSAAEEALPLKASESDLADVREMLFHTQFAVPGFLIFNEVVGYVEKIPSGIKVHSEGLSDEDGETVGETLHPFDDNAPSIYEPDIVTGFVPEGVEYDIVHLYKKKRFYARVKSDGPAETSTYYTYWPEYILYNYSDFGDHQAIARRSMIYYCGGYFYIFGDYLYRIGVSWWEMNTAIENAKLEVANEIYDYIDERLGESEPGDADKSIL